MENEQVALLRERLELTSSVTDGAATNANLFDDAVEAAVKDFQKSHGAAPDGVVGAGTRRMLNQQHHEATDRGKERLILVNMERWRWLPHDLGAFYVNVNVPEFMLRIVADGKVIHTTRVVAGKPDKQTAIFSQDMQEVVFNPYWNVPNSIKTEELLPYLTGGGGGWFGGGWDTTVLQNHNLHINMGGREVDPSTINWDRVDIRSLNIYQPPGPDNVLGTVKFVFPNKHDIYMHDTTQKFLFAKDVRAESHGCMRVQNPDQVATIILKHDQGWTAGRVAAAIQGGADQHVALEHKIPVYITYFTAWVNSDGSLSTFNDIYGHDARMTAALFGGGVPFEVQAQGDEMGGAQWQPPNNNRRARRDSNDTLARLLSGIFGELRAEAQTAASARPYDEQPIAEHSAPANRTEQIGGRAGALVLAAATIAGIVVCVLLGCALSRCAHLGTGAGDLVCPAPCEDRGDTEATRSRGRGLGPDRSGGCCRTSGLRRGASRRGGGGERDYNPGEGGLRCGPASPGSPPRHRADWQLD